MHFTIDNDIKNIQAEWDQYVQTSDNGTIFHERKFIGYHPPDLFIDHSLIFRAKNKIIALLPAVEKQRNKKKYLISHEGASYGGFVYQDMTIGNAFFLVEDFPSFSLISFKLRGSTWIMLLKYTSMKSPCFNL